MTVPPYGSLSPGDEHKLYLEDRATWIAYVAKAAAEKLVRGGIAALSAAWPHMGEDYRRGVWAYLDEDTRAALRAARATAQASEQPDLIEDATA